MLKNNQKIPEGWSVKKLGDLGIFSKGSGITKNDLVSDGLPCIRYAELYTKYNFVIPNCVSFISEEVSKTAKPIQCGDILFAGSGETKEEIGKCAVYDNPITAYAGGDNIILHPSGVNSVFLSYFLNTAGRRYLNRLGQGDSIVHIHAEHLKKIYVPIPPLPEQEKIAEIFGVWDEAIEKLSNLIEQKKLLKKGLMQKLLTGKTRLPGFTQPWKEVKLGDYLKFQTGFPFNSEFFNQKSIGVRLVKNRDLKSDDQMYFYSGVYSEDFVVQNGDILVGMDGDFLPCLWDKGPALLNQRVGRVLCKSNLKHDFARYILLSPLEKLQNETASTTVKHLSHTGILKIKVLIPVDILEQQAIADVLSTADDEINLLNQKLEALKEQKKGLMQQLLTGQIRVKVN